MGGYQIVCVTTEHPHRHIVDVGIGDDPRRAWGRWGVRDVRAALAAGDRFFTVSPSTGARADVVAADCPAPGCTVKTIRSAPDAIADNNLENLRRCNWRR